MVIWQGSLPDGEFETDLSLGTPGGAAELEGSEFRRIVRVNQVLEWESEDTD